ncbi:GNAT family N-acetyltransferase [Candidatus Bealeia paramacronuclearis]|uniref:GNAT family N-acetyltransferase n=1 Tax=Candidatus Bealeia paramacronuclearis TaxID=1921001 RepID=UPI002D1ABAA1|nr:GNAT family N-acetyltransferase [Candidatus Bealeia paramacronuclearis]
MWFQKSKLIQIPGYKKPFKIPGNLEITLSPLAHPNDCLKVGYGLMGHNRQYLENFSETLIYLPHSSEPFACAFQESISGAFDDLLLQLGASKTATLLMKLEKEALQKGIRRSYISVKNGKEPIEPLSLTQHDGFKLSEFLRTHGYVLTGETPHLKEPVYTQNFYKELLTSATSKQDLCDRKKCLNLQLQKWQEELKKVKASKGKRRLKTSKIHHISSMIFALEGEIKTFKNAFEWRVEPQEESPPVPLGNFGVFVRKNGIIKGGLFGTLNTKDVVIPHSDIDIFWIDSSVRGTGLGSKVMNAALSFSKSQGAHIAQLGTIDFQAPGFYEKMNFQRINTSPKILKTLKGNLVNAYTYRKEI